MPIRAVLFDLGNTLVSYYQPTDFMPILRRSLQACLLTLGHTTLGREAQTKLVHQALELNQERADHAVWPLEERLRVLFSHYMPGATLDASSMERLCGAFLQPIFATARVNEDALPVLTGLKRRGVKTAIVSNAPWGSSGRAWRTELARHDLFAAVDAVVFCSIAEKLQRDVPRFRGGPAQAVSIRLKPHRNRRELLNHRGREWNPNKQPHATPPGSAFGRAYQERAPELSKSVHVRPLWKTNLHDRLQEFGSCGGSAAATPPHSDC